MRAQSSADPGYGYCKCGCGQKTKLAKRSYHAQGVLKGEPFNYVLGHTGYLSTPPWKKAGPDYRLDAVTGCWIWLKSFTAYGYGQGWWDGRQQRAHKYYYEQAHGPVPEGLEVDHTCHNVDQTCPGGVTCLHRACVNPAHLTVRTSAENVQRGRLAKLTTEQVRKIKAEPRVWGSTRKLAAEYGVSDRTISDIRAGRTWANVQAGGGLGR